MQVKDEKSIVNSMESSSLRAEDFKPTGVTEQKFKDADTTNAKGDGAIEKSATVFDSTNKASASTGGGSRSESTSTSRAQGVTLSTKESSTPTRSTYEPIGPVVPEKSKEKLAVIRFIHTFL